MEQDKKQNLFSLKEGDFFKFANKQMVYEVFLVNCSCIYYKSSTFIPYRVSKSLKSNNLKVIKIKNGSNQTKSN